MILEFKGKKPKIGKDVFVAPTAVIVGDVEIKAGASIWFGTVIRGDLAPVRIGRKTNIQDNCTIHTDVDKPAIIGDNVTVGHNAVVHGCTVENNCLIGINAVVLSAARVRTGSVVAAGSLVRQGQEIGPWHLVAGVPAEMKKRLSEETVAERRKTAESYTEIAGEYMKMIK
ncbi:MAG: gamma carbonic anhydrase family protein [Pseudomonadota bacterium]